MTNYTVYIVDHSPNKNGGAESFSHKLSELINMQDLNIDGCTVVNSIDDIDFKGNQYNCHEGLIVIFTANWLRQPYVDSIKVKEKARKSKVFLISNTSALTPLSYLYDDIYNHIMLNIEKARKAHSIDMVLCLNDNDSQLWEEMGFETMAFSKVLDVCTRATLPTKLVLCYMTPSNTKCIELNHDKAKELQQFILQEHNVEVPIITYTKTKREPEDMFNRTTILFHESITEGRPQAVVECKQCGGIVVGSYPEHSDDLELINIKTSPREILKRFKFGSKQAISEVGRIIRNLLDYDISYCKDIKPKLWWSTLIRLLISSDSTWKSFGFIPPRKKK